MQRFQIARLPTASIAMGMLAFACSGDDDASSAAGGSGGGGAGGGGVVAMGGGGAAGEGGTPGGGSAGEAAGGAGGGAGAMGADAGVPVPVALDPLDYTDESLWLCLPGASGDLCSPDQTVTAILPDDTTETRPPITAATAPTIDCFYVYPTVSITDPVGNKTDLDDPDHRTNILDPLMSQFAPLKDLCAEYAPLYRQITFPTYQTAGVDAEGFLDVAYEDVEDAFEHYMASYNQGRDIVLVGHSQGSHMLRRLLQRKFEGDAALTGQLLVGMLIGPVGDITVPVGEVVGSTFTDIPLCTADDERGCVITYNSYGESFPAPGAPPAGLDWACTNPGALAGGPALGSGALAPSVIRQSIFDLGIDWGVTSDLVLIEDFFTVECTKNADGKSFLQVSATPGAGDQRTDRIPYDAPLLDPALLGLHVMDYVFPMAELKDQIRSRM